MTCPLRYATKRETLPNISSYPVAHEVIFQAVKNTWERVIQVMECEMEIAELEEANMNLALWLMDTFTGQNEHFSCESEFNETMLLTSLKETIGAEVSAQNPNFDFDDDEAFMFNAFAFFVSEIFVVLKESNAMQEGLDNNPAIEAFVDLWSLRLTGAPVASDFQN